MPRWLKRLIWSEHREVPTVSAAADPSPKLAAVLQAIEHALLADAGQLDGPSLESHLVFAVDCRDDQLLHKILLTKGGKITVEINLAPDFAEDGQWAARMAQLQMAGVDK